MSGRRITGLQRKSGPRSHSESCIHQQTLSYGQVRNPDVPDAQGALFEPWQR